VEQALAGHARIRAGILCEILAASIKDGQALAACELTVEFGQERQSFCLRAPGRKRAEARLGVMLRKGDGGKLGVFAFWYPHR
jgi:hypothetical protein